MKLKISLAIFNRRSASASLEYDDTYIEVANRATPKAACLAASKALRTAADRFDVLATAPDPFKEVTQVRINRMKLSTGARPPLTIAEVEAIIARWSYELHGDRARFIVRETELAHGIGEKK